MEQSEKESWSEKKFNSFELCAQQQTNNIVEHLSACVVHRRRVAKEEESTPDEIR